MSAASAPRGADRRDRGRGSSRRRSARLGRAACRGASSKVTPVGWCARSCVLLLLARPIAEHERVGRRPADVDRVADESLTRSAGENRQERRPPVGADVVLTTAPRYATCSTIAAHAVVPIASRRIGAVAIGGCASGRTLSSTASPVRRPVGRDEAAVARVEPDDRAVGPSTDSTVPARRLVVPMKSATNRVAGRS